MLLIMARLVALLIAVAETSVGVNAIATDRKQKAAGFRMELRINDLRIGMRSCLRVSWIY
jgi:hypothetical protein